MATPSLRSSSPAATTASGAAPACGLHEGLRLPRAEFERRSAERPDLKNVELIDGVVRMPSAVRYASHAKPHAAIVGWLFAYAAATPGVHVVDNATLRLDGDNDLQPDAALQIDPGAGGQARVSADDYVEGAPELVAEIAASSASRDLREKLHVYRRNGVREYLVWRVPEGRLDWFELVRGAYRARAADAGGVVRSVVFPGLWLGGGGRPREGLGGAPPAQSGARPSPPSCGPSTRGWRIRATPRS